MGVLSALDLCFVARLILRTGVRRILRLAFASRVRMLPVFHLSLVAGLVTRVLVMSL